MWARVGLLAAASLLSDVGEASAAKAVEVWAADVERQLEPTTIDGEPTARGLDRAVPTSLTDADQATATWTAARAVLVDDTRLGRLDLLPGMPPAWFGQAIEVHGLPTRQGTLSYALRWHGVRPALLWELADTRGQVSLAAPGLDRAWCATSSVGEALLSSGSPLT
jgi:hypothetical protein